MNNMPLLIWCEKHQAYWSSDESGYTTDKTRARQFSEAQATGRTKGFSHLRIVPLERRREQS